MRPFIKQLSKGYAVVGGTKPIVKDFKLRVPVLFRGTWENVVKWVNDYNAKPENKRFKIRPPKL